MVCPGERENRPSFEAAVAECSLARRSDRERRLEIEAGALRKALSALVRQVEDSGLHRATCICTRYDTDDVPEGAECECFDPAMEEALAALSGSAGRRTLAQLEAGRQIAEAVRGYYTASVDGVVGVQAEDAMRAALAAWDRAAAGEGGAT